MPYSASSQRYFNEQVHLPNAFFNKPELFMQYMIAQKGRFLAGAYNHLEPEYRRASAVHRYAPEDFQVLTTMESGRLCAVIRPPEPKSALQCKAIGCSIRPGGRDPVWRMVERTEEDIWVLGGWTKDRRHLMIGEISADPRIFLPHLAEELFGQRPENAGFL